MFPVVFRSSGHFGFARFCFCVLHRTWNWNQTPINSSSMKLYLSGPINLLSFPWKIMYSGKLLSFSQKQQLPFHFLSQNFFVNFHLNPLPQKLYLNFSLLYLFLERRYTIYDTHISFWNRLFTKCRSMNCKLDKFSKNI